MVISKKTPPETIKKVIDLFNENKWSFSGEGGNYEFNAFCEMFKYLDTRKQECILKLTKKFLRIDFSFYIHHLQQALTNIPEQALNNVDNIHVLPIKVKEDQGKAKGSYIVAPLLSGREIRTSNILNLKIIQAVQNRIYFDPILSKSNWKLLLVDDFIGTGETAEKAVAEIQQDTGVDQNKIIVLTLVAQEEGFQRLIAQGLTTVYSVLRKKGISDEYLDPIKQEMTATMESIENLLKLKEDFRFGYKHSEALVTLNRTPNNTFPIYWRGSSIKEKNWKAPFPRND